MPGTLAGDLSVIWAENMIWDKNKKKILNMNDNYFLQTGAWNNNFSRISKNKAPTDITLSYNKFILEKGRKYKIRAEINGLSMKLFIDSKLICQYKGLFPMNSGYVGLYGFYPGKAFDNIKIYYKGIPEKMNAIYTGDYLYKNGMLEKALVFYLEVLHSQKGKTISDEALYKGGLCLYSLGKKDQAYKLWKTIKDDKYRRLVTFHLWIKKAMENGAHDQVLKEMEEMYANSNVRQQQEIINEWGMLVGMISASSGYNNLDKYIKLRQKLFKDDVSKKKETVKILLSMGRYEEIVSEYPEFEDECAQALIALGRPEDFLKKYPDQRSYCAHILLASGHPEKVLKEYPDQRSFCAQALLVLDRSEEVLKKYPDQIGQCVSALITLGRSEEVLKKYPDRRGQCALALIALGRFEEVLKKYPNQRGQCAQALIALGRPEEVLKKYPNQRGQCALALIALGRFEEVLKKYPDQRSQCAQALLASDHPEEVLKKYSDNIIYVLMANYYMGFKLLEAENYGKAKKLLSTPLKPSISRYYYMDRFAKKTHLSLVELIYLPFTWYLINPEIPLEQRLKDALATKKHFNQVLWYQANFILGNISEKQFLKQPEKLRLESRLILAKALKAEYKKEKEKAIQYYAAYKALPGFKKALFPVIDAFVEWRSAALSK